MTLVERLRALAFNPMTASRDQALAREAADELDRLYRIVRAADDARHWECMDRDAMEISPWWEKYDAARAGVEIPPSTSDMA